MAETEQQHPTFEDAAKTKDAAVITNWWRCDIWMEDTSEATSLALHALYLRQFMPIMEPA